MVNYVGLTIVLKVTIEEKGPLWNNKHGFKK